MSVTREHPCRLQRDPVCGRELSADQALLTTELKGRTYLFCSERCRMLFSIRPAWFVDGTGEAPRRKASQPCACGMRTRPTTTACSR